MVIINLILILMTITEKMLMITEGQGMSYMSVSLRPNENTLADLLVLKILLVLASRLPACNSLCQPAVRYVCLISQETNRLVMIPKTVLISLKYICPI